MVDALPRQNVWKRHTEHVQRKANQKEGRADVFRGWILCGKVKSAFLDSVNKAATASVCIYCLKKSK